VTKKLYVVTITVEVEAIVLAESEKEACEAEDEIMRTEDIRDARMTAARPLTSINGKPMLPNAWDDSCLVYGADGDLSVAEAVKQFPPEPVEQKKLL